MADPAAPRESAAATPRYTAAGVDIAANDRLIPRYRALARAATRPEVLGGVGVFSGLFDLTAFDDPVLVASTDGVGTKVLVARRLGRLDGVGRDIVNHCINDILTAGARPLFFLDYLAGNGLSEDEKVAIVGGVAAACADGGLALLGGETADMPGLYRDGDFDLAGTIVGVVRKGHEIDGRGIRPGDALIGLPSNGLHTNGYTLARAVLHLDDARRGRSRGARRRARRLPSPTPCSPRTRHIGRCSRPCWRVARASRTSPAAASPATWRASCRRVARRICGPAVGPSRRSSSASAPTARSTTTR